MKLQPRHEQILKDIGGQFPDGTPKLRIVLPSEAVRPHGKWKGTPKYVNPDTGEPMNCLVLEQWFPASMLGEEKDWPTELMGVYPRHCGRECCRHGFWGIRSPLMYGDGKFLPLTDALMEAIKRKAFFDVQWADLSDIQRQEELDAQWSRAEKMKDEIANETADVIFDDYLTHKEREDAADTRVWSLGEHDVTVKGNKQPIGKIIYEPSS